MRRTGLRVPGALLEYRGPDRWIERGIEFMNHRLSLILFTVLVVGGGSRHWVPHRAGRLVRTT
jgi:hypothetical protein